MAPPPPPPVSSRASPSSTSNDMDLLSLVGDSMSYMNSAMSPPAPPPASDSSTTDDSSIISPTTPPSTTDSSSETADDPLADIDLSTLTLQDRALLQPLLDLIQGDGSGEESESDLARRMDEAENVASGLEGMLDSLLERLGGILGEEGLDMLGEEEDDEWVEEDGGEEGEKDKGEAQTEEKKSI